MNRFLFPLALLFCLSAAPGAFSQAEEELLAQLLEEEHNSVEALALYPEDTRLHILEAAKYPEAIIKMETLQSGSSKAFKELMGVYPQATREVVWDLTRYHGLIDRMVEAGGATPAVLADYPQEIHQRAQELVAEHYPLLTKVQALNRQSEGAFNKLLRDYPPAVQDAMRQLVELPEVLTLLTENIRLTVLVGDLYRRNPKWFLEQMDSLNLAAARERSKEIEEWKNSIEANPQAKEELAQSADAFAGEYRYDDEYYDDDLYADESEAPLVIHHYYNHYSWWFGYPDWYWYPRWRPYPYWYDWGFYWGPGHTVVIIDLPSFYFTDWFFYQPWHHHHYSHLSSHFVNHYYGHRHSGSGVTAGVEGWRKRNREVVTDEWLDNARKRPESFKEFGKFEEERQKYNRNHVDKPVSQNDYLEKNRKKYPNLVKQTERKREQAQAKREEPPTLPQRKGQPPIEKPKTKVPIPPKPDKSERIPLEKQPRRKGNTEPTSKGVPQMDKAIERHESIWNRSKKESVQPRSNPNMPSAKPPKSKTQKPATAPKVRKERNGE